MEEISDRFEVHENYYGYYKLIYNDIISSHSPSYDSARLMVNHKIGSTIF